MHEKSAVSEKFRAFFARKLTWWQRFNSLLRNIATFDVINIGTNDLEETDAPGIKYRDITEIVNQVILRRNMQNGIVNIQSQHTTASLVLLVQENEHGLVAHDIPMYYIQERLKPEYERLRERTFTHDREERIAGLGGNEPRNGVSHLLAANGYLCCSSITCNVHKGVLNLGQWQSVLIYFFDFDSGPHHPGRQISIVVQRVLP